jgi:ferredoxin
MKIDKLWTVYFSPTGTTQKIVRTIGETAASDLGIPPAEYDFSLPKARETFPEFSQNHLVVFGVPVYAGRIPNLLLKSLGAIRGQGALAVPVVLFGNRNYDDALIELRDILTDQGLLPIAAGAFVGEHSFSTILAKGRPDYEDLCKAQNFAHGVVQKTKAFSRDAAMDLPVAGTPKPYRGYYQLCDRYGETIDIRKVKPVTGPNCTDCKRCADVCSMGSIDRNNVKEAAGICTKCSACVKRCPVGAKSFTDENFLYHQHELEEHYTRRAEPELFL